MGSSSCDVVLFEIQLLPVDGGLFDKEAVCLYLTVTASSETRSRYQWVHKEIRDKGKSMGGLV